MSFCPHHVYMPTGEDVAWYCPLCNPWYPEMPFDTRAVHIPRVLHERQEGANRKDYEGSGCPSCSSPTFAVISGRNVECADCGHRYERRKSFVHVLGLQTELTPEEQEAIECI